MEANKTILQMKYARIVSIFAEQTGITLEDALNFFYTSSIYQMMNEGIADMHCRSDGYLANLVKEEWKNKKVQQNQLIMQNNSVLERSYINDFHRQSSLAALKGEQYMLLLLTRGSRSWLRSTHCARTQFQKRAATWKDPRKENQP